MQFVNEIYSQLMQDADSADKKATFFSVINYFVANESCSKKDIEERFSLRKESYTSILSLLKEKDIIQEQDDSSYTLRSDAKQYLSPLLQNVLVKSYSSKYAKNFIQNTVDCPEVNILLDCRENLYSAM